ncbi:helix-turn-helix transcriptional regulator [Ureaplasma sp. ES3154-GEN]|uniref:helix-turn-helix domain-containing protein n=1 Tax=Ureaplasma sp. ES3154-GEN TaxID=2984844 RepID=UPI0021E8642C|nr:helix-turn-helix transcriptional regulator [Ureaplasma sp. ES3154-GEN]MCV3743846.1 helix-turn-helix transcriptional regulator [Ureaplasma sp. ES3154-GEN]
MNISYKPLWRQLLDKDMKKVDLMKLGNFSPNLMANMSKDKFISLKNIVKICEALNCKLDDVIELKKECINGGNKE